MSLPGTCSLAFFFFQSQGTATIAALLSFSRVRSQWMGELHFGISPRTTPVLALKSLMQSKPSQAKPSLNIYTPEAHPSIQPSTRPTSNQSIKRKRRKERKWITQFQYFPLRVKKVRTIAAAAPPQFFASGSIYVVYVSVGDTRLARSKMGRKSQKTAQYTTYYIKYIEREGSESLVSERRRVWRIARSNL